jgi:ATP-dependent helicase HrpA
MRKQDVRSELAESRRSAVPPVTYPPDLPVSRRKDDIAAAIRDHQVVVVAGETGSGKTTQLPKVCLELGRGVDGMIGHTQPRRLAARTVAERIAEELGVPLGEAVGYTVRFTDRASERTLVRVMTDGILLAEIQRDPMLRRYDTLILDEAHERSLNIDFLLGYLTRLLPRRPDLKVVITSATIDPERFSAHFGGAPTIEVSGRTYPVEIRYRPLVAEEAGREDRDQPQGICDAVAELCAEGPGDILVFLSGEREIRDTADALSTMDLKHTEVLPLYARLSAAEQHRVFRPHPGRRIVLATNVAETSLTVPGVRYVVDPGTARISRYSRRTKVQRLPIEPISRASGDQRAGRCGRVADGVCVRLYAEADLAARPEFTDPEILRTNLASVILQMTALGLGDVASFPFLDPPDRRSVSDGVALLHELGALDPTHDDPRRRLTPLGRRLARIPLDPRLARMILEAERNGCVREVIVIAAALSIVDPRERPADRQQAAAEKHARFADPTSDFLGWLALWRHLSEQQRALSSGRFRRMCRAEFLHYLRVREWQDLDSQLRQVARQLKIRLNDEPAGPAAIHRSLLAGLLSHVGLKEGESRDYLGARGARFAIAPGSALFRTPPRWVMAAELVETSRLWARMVARIEPDDVERLAGHLVNRTWSEPRWERTRGGAVAQERVTLYGVPIVASRTVDYARIDPELSRELFLRHALVEGDWQTHHRFLAANRALLADVEDLEHRARRRDLVVDDDALFDFYEARVPADVVSSRHFDAWWKKARRTRPDLLTFTEDVLLTERAAAVSAESYPDSWRLGDLGSLPLTYRFEPGARADGVTVHVPLPALTRVAADGLDWQVPGLRESC